MTADRAGRIDPGSRAYRYYRNAVERHWDPAAIDLAVDRDRVADLDPVAFDQLRTLLALFGAGEESVTEDLAPLAVVLEDVNDQLFLTTQLYEEGKHAEFFDRYWREVVHAAEDARGLDPTRPTDDRWFSDAYVELFDRNEAAMLRLLDDDTPENRARAYCHYHLTIEGILAQTGYYGAQSAFSGDAEHLPALPGLVQGFAKIRGDEGRHVGFGMAKLQALVADHGVEPSLLHELTGDLSVLVQEALGATRPDDPESAQAVEVREQDLVTYAAEKHSQRLTQILEDDAAIPAVEELVRIED
jgi:ribonucleoside-diphosphate reductase beta chain